MLAELIPDIHAYLRQAIEEAHAASEYSRALIRLLDEYSSSNRTALVLPLLACQAAGGEPRRAIPAAAAWRALHIAAHVLDDVEDGDTAAWEARALTPARIINLSTGFIAAAGLCLAGIEHPLPARRRRTLLQAFNGVILQMAGGQHLDLSPEGISSLEAYFECIQAKSGTFFALATLSGAVSAASAPDVAERYYKFGYNLGIIVQLLNDLVGFYTEEERCDLADGKRTLPILFVEENAPPQVRAALRLLLPEAPRSQTARQQIRDIVREQGGDAYVFAEITRHQALASESLLPGDDPAGLLEAYLDKFLHTKLSRLYQLP